MHITIYPRVDIKILLTYVKCPLVQQYRHPRSNTHTHARNRRDVAQSTAISKRLFPASTLYMEQRNGGRPLNVGTVATSSLPLPIHPSIHPTIHPSASLPSPLVPLYIDGRAPRLPLRAATPANLTTTSSQVICPEINFPFGYCGPRKRYYVTNYSSY